MVTISVVLFNDRYGIRNITVYDVAGQFRARPLAMWLSREYMVPTDCIHMYRVRSIVYNNALLSHNEIIDTQTTVSHGDVIYWSIMGLVQWLKICVVFCVVS